MPDATARRARPKVAVLAWDVGHNPLGRAYVLADLLRRRFDVEIWGAAFPRYGSRVWAPLRHAAIPIHTFAGQMFPGHLAAMEAAARSIDADAIWVSKPRLPSYALGMLSVEARNRPLVLDVDDDELAFFGRDDGIGLDALTQQRSKLDLAPPFGETWTRACQPLIDAADQVTVSNRALQKRVGGQIVPHARDEATFDPQRYDRAEIRRRLGIDPDDRVLLFGGTARAHKGVVDVLEALERLGDTRYRLATFATGELDDLRKQLGPLVRWLLPIPYPRFDELAAIVAAADLACVLQDPTNPVSRYQMPAKVSDALAMAVPCLVSPVPPLQSLIDQGVLQVFDGDRALEDRIVAIFDDYDEAVDRAGRGRAVFLESYSYGAAREVVEPMFERLLDRPPPARPRLDAFVGLLRDTFPTAGGADAHVGTVPEARVPGQRNRTVTPGEPYDLVMFWKQNDTSIYGRRQDMFLKYLERSGRFHTIVHFDNPITPEAMIKNYALAKGAADQRRLVVHQTLKRLFHRRDRGRVRYRTYLYGGRHTRRLPMPKDTGYVDYVASVLARTGIGARPTVFWVYPTNDDLPALIDALEPDVVVADVVDDDRTWHTPTSPYYDRIDLNYERVLARSDVVLANCAPVAENLRVYAPEIHVVPNACDPPDASAPSPLPKELRGLHGPIIGYVGNLSARIDIALLEAVARARPQWQFVFVGSAHFDQSILRLDALENVHFVGLRPYAEAQRFVAHFDVALIPHVDNAMTRSMNPLKAYVYVAAGVPVVSTPIANLGELGGLVAVAEGPEAFVAAIEAALASGKRALDRASLDPISWPARVATVMKLIDAAMSE
jgi:glycosyltransferase involved in cell wall biosynthesis